VLQAFEFMDSQTVKMVLDNMKDARNPFPKNYAHYALIEIASSGIGLTEKNDNDLNRLMTFIE
jgi:hypothetical protein